MVNEIMNSLNRNTISETELAYIEEKLNALNSKYLGIVHKIMLNNSVPADYKIHFSDERSYNYFIKRLKEEDIKGCFSLIDLLFQNLTTSALQHYCEDLYIVPVLGIIARCLGEDRFPLDVIKANVKKMSKSKVDEIIIFLTKNEANHNLIETYVEQNLL